MNITAKVQMVTVVLSLFVCGSFWILPSFGGEDVVIHRNPDGTVDVYDATDSPRSSTAVRAPARSSRSASAKSSHKAGTQHYPGGVVVRKNADGSIETYDADAPAASRSTRQSGITKHPGGVVVKKNADGSIETYDSEDVPSIGSSHRSARSKGGGASVRHYSDLVVKRNPDGTVETYEVVAPAGSARRTAAKAKPKPRRASASPRRTLTRSSGGVYVRRNPDGTVETFDAD
ncbi:MAG TPA: hypothetical protein V6D17_07330 [Candidatus Obscuribacterales bacterium]